MQPRFAKVFPETPVSLQSLYLVAYLVAYLGALAPDHAVRHFAMQAL